LEDIGAMMFARVFGSTYTRLNAKELPVGSSEILEKQPSGAADIQEASPLLRYADGIRLASEGRPSIDSKAVEILVFDVCLE
jgi:hypothetical protein